MLGDGVMLRRKLQNLLQTNERDITYTELARLIGKDSSLLTKFFNYETELSFSVLLDIVTSVDEKNSEDEMTYIIDILIEEDRSPSNIRCAMDFLYNKKKIPQLSSLINHSLNSGNKDKKDWAKLWGVAVKHIEKEKSYCELLEEVKRIYPSKRNNFESYVLKELLEIYCYYYKKQYSIMFEKAETVLQDLHNIKNSYLQDSFKLKFNEVMANAYLYAKGDIKSARDYANEVKNSNLVCEKFKFNAYYILGTSYMFENFQTSMDYFLKYIDYISPWAEQKYIDRVINDDIAFLKVYWGKVGDFYTNDPLSQAYFEAKYGDKQKALTLINGQEGGYAEFIKAVALDDPTMLFNSMIAFERFEKNLFLYRLPLIELKNYNRYEDIAQTLFNQLPS